MYRESVTNIRAEHFYNKTLYRYGNLLGLSNLDGLFGTTSTTESLNVMVWTNQRGSKHISVCGHI